MPQRRSPAAATLEQDSLSLKIVDALSAQAVGNLAAAQVDLMFAGKDRGSQPALAEARQLWSTHGFPTLWGTGHLPLLPSKRSSVAVEWADIQLCKAALPATSLFSTAVVYEGRVYVLGGRTVEFPMNRNMPMNINVFDPEKDTISQCVVAPDPKHGAPRPRTGHSAVLLGSVLITYGGDVRGEGEEGHCFQPGSSHH